MDVMKRLELNPRLVNSPKRLLRIAQRNENGFFRHMLKRADRAASALFVAAVAAFALWAGATALYNSRHGDQWLLIPPSKIGIVFQNGQDTLKLQDLNRSGR